MPTLDINAILSFLIEVALRIGAAALVFLVGRRLAKYLRDRLQRTLVRTGTVMESMVTLLTTVAYYGSVLLVVAISLAILGVPVTALAAIFAVAIVILGLAFQQSLANFAATINILLFKPFTVGEDIEALGTYGTVQEIQLFNTLLLEGDLKLATLPNAKIQGNGLVNYSRKGIIRPSVVVGISYSDDLKRAKEIVAGILAADPRVLADPPPQIFVQELGESSVNLAIRPCVKFQDYWPVQFGLAEAVKLRFDEAGITIPFPQSEVRLVAAATREES